MVPLTACSPFVDCRPLLGDGARLYDPLRYYWRPLPLRIQPAWHTVANQR